MFLDEASSTTYYQQIFDHFRRGIIEGTYPLGSKLPSIRGLSQELHCARNTVEAAYKMLVEEGYVVSKPGSGYLIQNSSMFDEPLSKEAASRLSAKTPLRALPSVRYDFNYGNLQAGTFPALTWRTLTDDVLMSVEARPMDTYTDPLGELELRQEIAWRLSMMRGITCSPEQIIIQGGTQPSVQNLLTLFDPKTDTIAMENPGYNAVRDAISQSHFDLKYCSVLGSGENFLQEVESSDAKLVYVTPSSQFPTTLVMNIEMRKRLIEWAIRKDAYILEDDYCREFRYHDRALPPLLSMNADRVIYMGTFSKSISPALRINYLIVPPSLMSRWKSAFDSSYPAVPWLSQAVLTRFLSDGHRNRHLRKQQTRNKRKYETLVAALDECMGNRVDVMKNGTGLHVLVNVRDGRSQEELIDRALTHGVRVYDTNRYWANQDHSLASCVLVGFSAIPEEDIRPGIQALSKAWFGD